MTDSKPMTAWQRSKRADIFTRLFALLFKHTEESIEQAEKVLDDYVAAHAGWPPGRPISEYDESMGEVLAETSNGKFSVFCDGQGDDYRPNYTRFWPLPTEGV